MDRCWVVVAFEQTATAVNYSSIAVQNREASSSTLQQQLSYTVMFTANYFADLCPLPLRTWWSEKLISWFVRTGNDVVYESVTVTHTIIQRRQIRVWDFWRNVVIIFQHSLSMFKVTVMPVRIICTNKKILKLLLNNSPSNVRKWIRLWTCEASQPMRISQISIDLKFNNVPSRRNF